MIEVEIITNDIKKKNIVCSDISWQNSDCCHKLTKEEKEKISIFKEEKLQNKYIKISCDDNSYIKIPSFKNHFFCYRYDDNTYNGELNIISEQFKTIYIPINSDEISFTEKSGIFRPYILDILSKGETIIERYSVNIEILYKDNINDDISGFDFDFIIRIKRIYIKNVTYGLVDHMFWGYFVWILINYVMYHENFTSKLNNPSFLIFSISFILYFYLKFKYVGNTLINRIWNAITKKESLFPNLALKKKFKKMKSNKK